MAHGLATSLGQGLRVATLSPAIVVLPEMVTAPETVKVERVELAADKEPEKCWLVPGVTHFDKEKSSVALPDTVMGWEAVLSPSCHAVTV